MYNTPFEINENSEKRYYEGWINRGFRVFWYYQEALSQIGALKTIAYFLIAFGLIFSVDSKNYLLLGLIGVATTPFLVYFGYIMVTRGNKSMEYFRMKYLSPWGRYGIQMSEEQLKNSTRNIGQNDKIIELLEEINEKLK